MEYKWKFLSKLSSAYKKGILEEFWIEEMKDADGAALTNGYAAVKL